MVIFGEVYFDVFAFAFFQAVHACFKLGQHLALTQYEGIVFGRTAGKGFAVDFACEVDDDAVAVFGRAFGVVEAGALLTQDVDGFFNFRIADGGGHFFNFLAGQIADFHFGEDFEYAGEQEVFFVVLTFNAFQTRHTGDFPAFCNGCVEEYFLCQFVHDVVLDAGAVHGLNHRQGSFSGAEAVDAGFARGLFQTLVAFCVDAAPRQGQRYFAFQVFKCF